MTKWTATAESLGLDPTGQVNDTSRVRDWLDQLPWVSAPGVAVRAGLLDLGVGRFRFDLHLDRSVLIRGAGGELRKPATCIEGDVEIKHATTGPAPSGYGSQLRDLGLYGALDVRTQVSIDHVYCVGGGARFIGTAGAGNVNESSVRHLVVEGAATGIEVFGGDANAIDFMGCRAFGCGKGFIDLSFLGCSWLGCAAEGCTVRGWEVCDQSGGSALFRCYSENGGGAAQDIVEVPAQVYGGSWNKGIGARPGKVAATWWNANQARGRFVVHNQAPNGSALSLSLGGTDAWHLGTLSTPDGHVLVGWYDVASKQIRINRGAWNGPLVWSFDLDG